MKTITVLLFSLIVSTIGLSQTKEKANANKEKTKLTYSKVSDRLEVRDNRGMLVYYIKQNKVSNRIEIRNKNNNLLQHYKYNKIGNSLTPHLPAAIK